MILACSRKHVSRVDTLLEFAWTQGIDVDFVPPERLNNLGAWGLCNLETRKILLPEGEPTDQTVATLAHELAHALNASLHKVLPRAEREAFAEYVSREVCRSFDLIDPMPWSDFLRIVGTDEARAEEYIDTHREAIEDTIERIKKGVDYD